MATVVQLADDELNEESATLLVVSADEAQAALVAVARALAEDRPTTTADASA
jgi:hypothetical protein